MNNKRTLAIQSLQNRQLMAADFSIGHLEMASGTAEVSQFAGQTNGSSRLNFAGQTTGSGRLSLSGVPAGSGRFNFTAMSSGSGRLHFAGQTSGSSRLKIEEPRIVSDIGFGTSRISQMQTSKVDAAMMEMFATKWDTNGNGLIGDESAFQYDRVDPC